MANAFDQYGAKVTAAQLAARTKSKLTDFRVGLVYYVAESVGMVPVTTLLAGGLSEDNGKQEWLVWRQKTVKEITINQDLFEFQTYLNQGNAYSATTVSTTAAVTTLGPTTTFNG